MLALILSKEFPLHIPCWLYFSVGSFSYTSHARFFFFFFSLGNFSYISRAGSIFIRGLSLTQPMLSLFLCWELRLHIQCFAGFFCGEFHLHIHVCFLFCFLNLGIFSYTSRADCIFMQGVSLTHPVLALFLSGEFLLHIPCWLHFYLGSFSYTSSVGFNFIWGVSLTHPVLTWVSLTHPVLASVLSREFLSHIPCWLCFSAGSFSYTSHARFFVFFF